MLHDKWLHVAFKHLLHIINVFGNLFQVAFFVVFLVKTFAQSVLVITFGMQAPIIEESFPIAMTLAFTVVTVQNFTGHNEAFAIGDDFTQKSRGVKNRRNAFFQTIFEGYSLYETTLSIIAVTFALFHIVDKWFLQNVLFTIGKARTVFQIILIIDNQSGVARFRKKHPSAVQKKIRAFADGLQLTILVIGLPKAVGLAVA